MEPLQCWIPLLGPSVGFSEVRGDVERAHRAWQGETTVWLSPRFDDVVRWAEGPERHVAVPATHVDRIDVYHVGDSGYVWGPASTRRFPGGRVTGLLRAWLNIGKHSWVGYHRAPERIPWRSPQVHGGMVRYLEGTLRVLAGAALPLRQVHNRRFTCSWEPHGRAAAVFPDAESGGGYAAPESANTPGFSALLEWPSPLQGMASLMSGLDDQWGQSRMVRLAREADDQLEGVLKQARDEAAPYVKWREGSTTEGLRWMLPSLVHLTMESRQNDPAVITALLAEAAQARFRLHSPQDYSAAMERVVPITRAWGMLGLCWALFLEELTRDRVRACPWCNWIMQGKRGKQRCGPEDNPDCYRKRGAARQHRFRERHR